MSQVTPPDYNPIFEKLVARDVPDPESLPGIVAYSLYKIAKREWATEHLARTGQRPSEAELKAYIATWTPSRLSGLEQEGNAVLLAFAEQVIEQNRGAIREEALQGSLGRSVWQGILAAAAYTVILIVLAVILKYVGIDLVGALQSVGPTPPVT